MEWPIYLTKKRNRYSTLLHFQLQYTVIGALSLYKAEYVVSPDKLECKKFFNIKVQIQWNLTLIGTRKNYRIIKNVRLLRIEKSFSYYYQSHFVKLKKTSWNDILWLVWYLHNKWGPHPFRNVYTKWNPYFPSTQIICLCLLDYAGLRVKCVALLTV